MPSPTNEAEDSNPLSVWNWLVYRSAPEILSGLCYGTLLGLAVATLWASWVGPWLLRLAQHITWPSHGLGMIVIAAVAAALAYFHRLAQFLRKWWISFWGGLVTGLRYWWLVPSTLIALAAGLTGNPSYARALLLPLAATVLTYVRDRILGQEREVSDSVENDNPIQEWKDDQAHREDVVKRLIETILEDRAQVVALTGMYGDGKTSVFNLLEKELAQPNYRDKAIVVRYSPWLAENEQALVLQLLEAVIAKLNEKYLVPALRRTITEFSRALVSLIPRAPSGLKEFFREQSQSTRISELCKSLKRLPVTVAVLLDDLDRMQPTELNALFKLLRGVSNFPQLSYVCACDRDALSSCLQQENSAMSHEEGLRFLEKFFPCQIALPQIEETTLADQLQSRLWTFLKNEGIPPAEESQLSFDDWFKGTWKNHLSTYFTNLRRIKQILLRLRKSFPQVEHDVNPYDFIHIEVLRMMSPAAYQIIALNRRFMTVGGWKLESSRDISVSDKDIDSARDLVFKQLLEALPKTNTEEIKDLIVTLFPISRPFFGGLAMQASGQSLRADDRTQKRICHPDCFPRYFILRVPQDQFGEDERSILVSKLKRSSEESQVEIFLSETYRDFEQQDAKKADFLRQLLLSIDSLSPEVHRFLPVAVAKLSSNFAHNTSFDLFEPLLNVLIACARHLSQEDAAAALSLALKGASDDDFAARLLLKYKGDPNGPPPEPHSLDVSTLEAAFSDRMNSKYGPTSHESLFPLDPSTGLRRISVWSRCGSIGKAQVTAYLRREFRDKPQNIGNFLFVFFPFIPGNLQPANDLQPAITAINKWFFPIAELRHLIEANASGAASTEDERKAVATFLSASAPGTASQSDPPTPNEKDQP